MMRMTRSNRSIGPCRARIAVCVAGIVTAGTAAMAGQAGAGEAEPTPPNVLLILVDDLGCRDLSGEGHANHRTPNIDRLRAESVRFTNAACNGPNCSPSRAALVTARHGSRTGVHTVGSSRRGKDRDRRLEPPANRVRIEEGERTIAETLAGAGYRTGFVGKWHVSDDPRTQGFEVNAGGNKAGHPKSYFPPYRNPDLEDGPEGEYLVDRLARETLGIIDGFEAAEDDRPWFVMYAPYAVHTPIQAPAAAVAEYRMRNPDVDQRRARYGVMVEATDRAIGSILARIDADETLVCFASDNGGLQPLTDMSPWRGGKGMLYEGGIRTPLYVRGADFEPRDVATPVQLFDLHPTITELAGAVTTRDVVIDAVSLVPLLRGEPMDRGPLFWHFPAYLEGHDAESRNPRDPFRTTPSGAVREGRWKLVEWFDDGEVELFDLESDPGERVNRSADRPEIRDRLKSRLAEWRTTVSAPMPRPVVAPASDPAADSIEARTDDSTK